MRPIDPRTLTKSFLEVEGKRMAFHERGEGRAIVFLHGNPTSSYLWRNVIPHVAHLGRCIAPDLLGQGDSAKVDHPGPDSYRFADHRRYLDGLLDALDLGDDVILVLHDWGSGLGFDWANRHRDRVSGIAFMEALVRPVSWDEWPAAGARVFQGFRSEQGEAMVLDRNLFVERMLPGSILRTLTPEELAEYRRPFLEREHRWPTLAWPRQVPIGGEPPEMVEIASSYAAWMAANDLPKLFVNAEPGAILTGAQRETCRSWPNLTEVTVRGTHFIQEDSPHEIGEALADWMPPAR
jgi:haloalkane dehalogenase